MIANSLATNKHKANGLAGIPARQDEAAKLAEVSRDSVTVAGKIAKKSPELAEQVRNGKVSLNAAETVSELPKRTRDRVVAKGPEAVREKARQESTRPRNALHAGKLLMEQQHEDTSEQSLPPLKLTPAQKDNVVERLESWYKKHRRVLCEYPFPTAEQIVLRIIREVLA